MTPMGRKGMTSFSSSPSIQSLKFENDEKKVNELFHIRLIAIHTNLDTLFGSGIVSTCHNMFMDNIVKLAYYLGVGNEA